jgi:transposase
MHSMQSLEAMLKNESRPEVLREMALIILENNQELSTQVQTLRAKKALEEKQNQEWLQSEIKAHLHKLQTLVFASGRETLKSRPRRENSEQLLLHAESLAGKAQPFEKADLPTEDLVHESTEFELIQKAQQSDPTLKVDQVLVEPAIGLFEVSTEITVTERVYKKVIHKRQKYRVKNLETQKETLVAAPGPVKLVPGSRYSVDFALSVVAGKFLNHLPYERQLKDMKRIGVDVPVMTMYRLSEQVALHMAPVVEDIREDIFNAELACHLDETRWPILNKHDSDGQMWILSNQAGSYYLFSPTRSGGVADDLLKGYSGAVLTDKFSGYQHFRGMKNITWGLCWAHARREFFNLREAYPDVAEKVVLKIDKLCELERGARSWEALKQIRETKSLKLLSEIKQELEVIQREFFDQSELCKAANYILSGWAEFSAFTANLALSLTNNDAERALRHAVLGRKNFNGSKTINGADTAATLYSVIESCKKVEIDPISYMKYVIEKNHINEKPLTPLKYARKSRGLEL